MERARRCSSRNSPSRVHWLNCVIAVSAALGAYAVSARAADTPADTQASAYLGELVRNSAKVLPYGGSGCLSQENGATFGREIAAILENFADSKTDAALGSRCEPEGDDAQHCILSFSIAEGEEQASAGFMFTARKSDGTIDLGSVKCFQTP
jgi:hypothetical protein